MSWLIAGVFGFALGMASGAYLQRTTDHREFRWTLRGIRAQHLGELAAVAEAEREDAT